MELRQIVDFFFLFFFSYFYLLSRMEGRGEREREIDWAFWMIWLFLFFNSHRFSYGTKL